MGGWRMTILFLAACAISLAQEGQRYEVTGSVQDPDGLPIPAAMVELIHPDWETPRETQTGVDGSFRFTDVPAGQYTLKARVPGFDPETKTTNVRRDVSVKLELEIEQVVTEVTAQAPTVETGVSPEPEENRSSLELDREALDRLPVMDQDVLSTAQRFLSQGALGTGGAAIIVDGRETETLGITPSAIQEVRINQNPYSAQFSRPGRGRIEIITREGTSEYHGEFNFLLRDYRLDARNALSNQRQPETRKRFEGHLTGPLGKKNTFLFSGERDLDDEQAIIFARTPTGTVNQVFPQPERETELSFRFKRYQSDRHQWSLGYSMERESNEGSGVGGFALPETATNEYERGKRLRFNHRWFASADFFTDLSVELEREREWERSVNPGEPRIIVEDAFTAGSAQANNSEREHEVELSFITSWKKGDHTIQTGFLIPDLRRNSQNAADNFGGTFRFASLADYEAGVPFSYTQRRGQSGLVFWNARYATFIQDTFRFKPHVTLNLGLRSEWQKFVEDSNNFAPRASLAWALGDERKTVVRAGGGIFYDRMGHWVVEDTLLFNGERLQEILITDPAFPNPAGSGNLAEVPPNIVRFSPDLVSPYMTQYSVEIERELRRGLTLSAGYEGFRGTKMLRSIDKNPPIPPDYARPSPDVNEIREMQSSGTMKRHALNMDLRGRITKYFQGALLYSLSSNRNDFDGFSTLPPDSLDLSGQWARADYDRRHRLRMTGAFDLPAKFNIGLILEAETGQPYELTTGRDINRDGRAAERPAGVGRNALQEPGAYVFDVRLSRDFTIGNDERPTLTVSADAFNLLNTVNYSRIVGNQSSPFFGQPVAADPARRMQLRLRLSF